MSRQLANADLRFDFGLAPSAGYADLSVQDDTQSGCSLSLWGFVKTALATLYDEIAASLALLAMTGIGNNRLSGE